MYEVEVGVREYLKELRGAEYNPISKDEEQKLLRKYRKTHDRSIRDRLIKSNMRYASSMVSPYVGKGLSYAELLSEAHDGLIESIDRYDGKYGTKLISYSKWWIMQRMKAAIEKRMNYDKSSSEFQVNIKNEDGEDEVEEVVGYDSDSITEYDVNEEELRNEEDKRTEYIETLMKVLEKRENEILCLYFGIGKDRAYTLSEIGKMFSISKERVRQIVEGAMSKLRSEAVLNQL